MKWRQDKPSNGDLCQQLFLSFLQKNANVISDPCFLMPFLMSLSRSSAFPIARGFYSQPRLRHCSSENKSLLQNFHKRFRILPPQTIGEFGYLWSCPVQPTLGRYFLCAASFLQMLPRLLTRKGFAVTLTSFPSFCHPEARENLSFFILSKSINSRILLPLCSSLFPNASPVSSRKSSLLERRMKRSTESTTTPQNLSG